jgi:uncharacterized protein YbaA (DUF1428 family)
LASPARICRGKNLVEDADWLAVQAKDGEIIVFSWIVYESRASRDAAFDA